MEFGRAVYDIWLSRCFGEGSPVAGGLLEQLGSAEEIWRQRKSLAKVLPKYRIDLKRSELCTLEEAAEIEQKSAEAGISVLTPQSPQWPRRLSAIPNPPVVLYVRGDLQLLEQIDELPAIAVVGTRSMTSYGARAAELFAMGLAAAGAVVVSGMAAGIDTMAHKGALKGGGKTLAVLGCGLDYCYPHGNEELMEIIARHGAVLSEYPVGEPPLGPHFPVRNRIISGLSVGVLVVEAKPRSGSLITANLAAEQGRDVFVLMTDYNRRGAEALSKLIGDGAKPVARVSDIINEYQAGYAKILKPQLADLPLKAFEEPVIPKRIEPVKTRVGVPKTAVRQEEQEGISPAGQPQADPVLPRIPETLSEDAKAVFDGLDSTLPKHIDQIASETGLPSARLLAAVTELEMEGLIKLLPGRHYLKETV